MLGKTFVNARVVGVGFVIIVAMAIVLRVSDSGTHRSVVKIGGESIAVEIVGTSASRERGLSGRKNLVTGTGMLFVFLEPTRSGFWMKDMRFPIDIIWIEGGRVIDIAPQAPTPLPTGDLPVYYPRLPASYVLEVPSGFSRDHNVKIDDLVDIKI